VETPATINAWEESGLRLDRCCGVGGNAYALLNLFRHSGARVWRERAFDLAGRVTGTAPSRYEPEQSFYDSLYKGKTGLVVLASDLAHPEAAAMPLFEPEGWPVTRVPAHRSPGGR
jgi:hypothetical protein